MGELKSLLMQDKKVFPIELLKRVLLDYGLRDKIEIKLVPGIEAIQ